MAVVCSVRACSGLASPACRMPFLLCFDLQAAHSVYWLTTGLKRATNDSKSFSDNTIKPHWFTTNKQAGIVVAPESLGEGEEQLIQAKDTRTFEGKQTPWCLCGFLGFSVVKNKSMTCWFLPTLPVFRVVMDLPDASKVLPWHSTPTW